MEAAKRKHFSASIMMILVAIITLICSLAILPKSAYAIDEVQVSTLSDLQTKMNTTGELKITLTADINITDSSRTYVYVNGTKTLNMNGHSINASDMEFVLASSVSLTVNGNGSFVSAGRYELFNLSGGTLTVDNGSFTNTSSGYIFNPTSAGSKLVVNGGIFLNNGSYQIIHSQSSDSENPPTVEINGGTWIVDNNGTNNYVWGSPASDTTVATFNG